MSPPPPNCIIRPFKPDATGLSEDNIEKVMDKANVTRKKAIKVLRKHNDDLVDALMDDDLIE